MKVFFLLALLLLCALPALCQDANNLYYGANGVPTWGATDATANLPTAGYNTLLANTPAPGAVVNVTANSATDLQTKLTAAVCGQRITLPAGSVYSGHFTIPALVCASTNYVWVVTSGLSSLPAEGATYATTYNGRTINPPQFGPCYAGVLSQVGRPALNCPGTPGTYTSQIITPDSSPPITFTAGTSAWRFIGLEVTRTSGTGLVSLLIRVGQIGNVDHIIFDRCWIHGDENQDETETGLTFNAVSYLAVVDSYMNNFYCISVSGVCSDSHAIFGGTNSTNSTTENVIKIVNGFIEASGENLFSGGGVSNTTPMGLEWRRNFLFKPNTWNPGDPSYNGGVGGHPFIVKNCIEYKNAQSALIEGNTCQNVWVQAQAGYAFLLNPTPQGTSCPACFVTNITYRYNVVNATCQFMQITEVGSTGGAQAAAAGSWSIHDNVADNLFASNLQCQTSDAIVTLTENDAPTFAQSLKNVSFMHNTIVQAAGSLTPVTLFGLRGAPVSSGNQMSNITVTNNLAWTGTRGTSNQGGTGCAFGLTGPVAQINNCWSPYTFGGNCFVNNGSVVWPGSNVTSVVSFTAAFINYNNGNAGNYTVAAGACKGAATDSSDPGANLIALASVLAGNPAAVNIPLGFQGIHYNKTSSLYPPVLPLAFGTCRLWDTATGWADLQSGPSAYNFTHLGLWLSKFSSPFCRAIWTLAKTPNFIASNTSDTNCGYTSALGNPNGSCTPPTDINCNGTGTDATWINFLTNAWTYIKANGYTGHIWGVEIWNEWNVPTFYDITYINSTKCPGTPNAAELILTTLEQDARCVIRGTNCRAGITYPVIGEEPAVVILSPPLPGPGNNNAQIKTGGAEDKLLTSGAGNYADYISIHGYLDNKGQTVANCGVPPANIGCSWPENVISMVNQLNVLQSSYSLNLPLVVSEGSWGAQANVTDGQYEQAFVGRYYISMLQYGVQVFDWYNIDGGSVSLPVLYANNSTGILTTGGAAVQTVQGWLKGKSFANRSCNVTAQPSCSGGVSSNVYECTLTSGERIVWYDEVADNAACSYNNTTGFGTYLTMNNTILPISGAITLDNRPIVLEPLVGPLAPTNLKITPGVKVTPGVILTKEPYEKDVFADLVGLFAGNN